MIRLLVAVGIIAGTTYIGCGLSGYYRRREKLFTNLCGLCASLSADIGFLLVPLDEILASAGREYTGLLTDVVEACRVVIADGAALTKESVLGKLSGRYLSEEEKSLIAGFFSVLGKSDAPAQLESIEGYKRRFEALEKTASEERTKYSPMLKKLGFLSGLALCILAI
jgi:stage III sporulation protein AB